MNKLILFLTFLLGPTFLFAQSIKMGYINENELALTEVPYETGAPAVILASSGDSRFFGEMLETTFFYRIKILTEAGKEFADVKIRYFRGENTVENISGVKASLVNVVDGRMTETKIGKEHIHDVEIGDGFWELRISFPDAQVGSILEYTYKKGDKNLTFLDGWSFQRSIPTLFSKYQIIMIPQLEYKMIGQGYNLFQNSENLANNGTFSWTLRNLHSLKEEPFMKNYRDYQERVEFQLSRYQSAGGSGYQSAGEGQGEFVDVLNTWEKLGDDLIEYYSMKGYYRTNTLEKGLLDLDLSIGSQKEKAEKAYYYLRDNLINDGEDWIYPDQTLNQLLKSKKGAPGELILAYMGVLKSQGITCDPVLIGSKGYGRSELVMFPFLNQFDEILLLAELDGKKQFIDLSDPLAPFGYVDIDKHVKGGLLLQKGKSALVPIEIKHTSNNLVFTNVELNSETGELIIHNTLRSHFYEGLKIAHAVKSYEKAEKSLDEMFTSPGEAMTVKNAKVEDLLQEKNYINSTFDLVMPGAADMETLTFNPLRISSFTKNPFTLEYRVFPVDFEYPFSEVYTANIKIPPGYEVDDYPTNENLTIQGSTVSFNYSVENLGEILKVTAKLDIRASLIPVQRYGDLKFLMESIAAKLSAPVILKKVVKP
ncbi:DUF3857 domain-containing protein [Algoriphagus lacus]|uniref:DUF3857 domain-containing protein n=1 Tax=Algoriphagus lacus TaxID=2056311 RepID=A0A418PVM4_9BACT|nr:DUF3857 domain-containing protein [Algoriphagus lacus]RIW18143.1 DUF3857 domain-containing protein [Algoriphagus lacus]